MMMNPLMSPEQIEQVLVRYGFARYVEYPGEYTVTNFQPQDIGRYRVVVQATEDNGIDKIISESSGKLVGIFFGLKTWMR